MNSNSAEALTTRINEKLRAALTIQDIYIQDKSGGCGQSFLVVVVAEDFKDMKLLERQ